MSPQSRASRGLFICFYKSCDQIATRLRSVSRPVSAKGLPSFPEGLTIKRGFACCQPDATPNAGDVGLNLMQGLRDVCVNLFPSKMLRTYTLSPWPGVNTGSLEAFSPPCVCFYTEAIFIHTPEGIQFGITTNTKRNQQVNMLIPFLSLGLDRQSGKVGRQGCSTFKCWGRTRHVNGWM